MKPAIFALALVSSAFAFAPIPTAQQAKDASQYVANAYIIELSGTGAVAKRTVVSVGSLPCTVVYRISSFVHQHHKEVYDAMRKRAIEFSIDQEYNAPDVLVGAAIRLYVGVPYSMTLTNFGLIIIPSRPV